MSERHIDYHDQDEWEDLDCTSRMWGVFAAEGYSANPMAIFRTEQDADEWLQWQRSRGDDGCVWVDVCVLAIDEMTGRCWNSVEQPPVKP